MKISRNRMKKERKCIAELLMGIPSGKKVELEKQDLEMLLFEKNV